MRGGEEARRELAAFTAHVTSHSFTSAPLLLRVSRALAEMAEDMAFDPYAPTAPVAADAADPAHVALKVPA